MARAILYLRVSTDEQAESRAGLDAQRDACRAAARRAGWAVGGEFADEGVSGAAPLDRRPGLLDAVAALGRGDVLLVAKRDRLGRDPIVVAAIEATVGRRGARVLSAAGEGTDGDGPGDVLMRRLVDAFAEYERLVIGARTRAALAAKRRRGERVGAVPLGARLAGDGRTLEADAPELAAVRLVRELAAAGLGARAIARELDRRGVPTKRGRGRWRPSSVARILERTSDPVPGGPPPCPSPPPPAGPETPATSPTRSAATSPTGA